MGDISQGLGFLHAPPKIIKDVAMNILVCSHNYVENGFLPSSPIAIISIITPGDKEAKIPESSQIQDILQLLFHDDDKRSND